MLWELRSEPTPWSFSICLRRGQGLNRVHRLVVCRGQHDVSVYPSEIESKIVCIFMSFWTEVQRKAVDQKGCN